MSQGVSLLDELRTQYEEARQSTHEHADVEGFQEIDARLRKAFRWLEKAITYLDGLKPAIPSNVSFRADYQTGHVTVTLVNVDRFDRVSLEFHSTSIDEPVLEDLVRLILGRDAAFLRRAPLAGIHGRPPGS